MLLSVRRLMLGNCNCFFVCDRLFIDGLLKAIGSVGHLRTSAEVQLQLLRILQVAFTATTERLLNQAVDFQLLSLELRFLLLNRRRLFGEQKVLLFRDPVFLLKQRCHLQLMGLQLSNFLIEQFEFLHAGQRNDL